MFFFCKWEYGTEGVLNMKCEFFKLCQKEINLFLTYVLYFYGPQQVPIEYSNKNKNTRPIYLSLIKKN